MVSPAPPEKGLETAAQRGRQRPASGPPGLRPSPSPPALSGLLSVTAQEPGAELSLSRICYVHGSGTGTETWHQSQDSPQCSLYPSHNLAPSSSTPTWPNFNHKPRGLRTLILAGALRVLGALLSNPQLLPCSQEVLPDLHRPSRSHPPSQPLSAYGLPLQKGSTSRATKTTNVRAPVRGSSVSATSHGPAALALRPVLGSCLSGSLPREARHCSTRLAGPAQS